MPARPRKKKQATGLHRNVLAWLQDTWPLPLPDEALELALDDFRPGHTRQEIWERHNPGKAYVDPWTWYARRTRENENTFDKQ